jgi:hypothetical protein
VSIQDDNKAIAGRGFTNFRDKTCDRAVVDEVAAPDMLLHYSLHAAPPAAAEGWLRHQRARIEQRHLQFGRHTHLDIGSLLWRAAHGARVARLPELAASREGMPNASAPNRHPAPGPATFN